MNYSSSSHISWKYLFGILVTWKKTACTVKWPISGPCSWGSKRPSRVTSRKYSYFFGKDKPTQLAMNQISLLIWVHNNLSSLILGLPSLKIQCALPHPSFTFQSNQKKTSLRFDFGFSHHLTSISWHEYFIAVTYVTGKFITVWTVDTFQVAES